MAAEPQSQSQPPDRPELVKGPDPVVQAIEKLGVWLDALNTINDRGFSKLAQEMQDGAKWAKRQFYVGLALAVLGILINLYIGLIRLPNRIAGQGFKITSPADREQVGEGQVVSGDTPFLDLKHYIVVTRASTPGSVVQAETATVDKRSGTFRGNARFPDPDEEYTIRVLATDAAPPTDLLSPGLGDVKATPSVKVTRQPDHRAGIRIAVAGGDAGRTVTVTGTTTMASIRHYVVVESPQGTPYVQDRPASISGGRLTGLAVLGAASAGVGQKFRIYVIATRTSLPPGPLSSNVPGGVESNIVEVVRTR